MSRSYHRRMNQTQARPPVDADGTKSITPRFRELAFQVMAGRSELAPFIHMAYSHYRSERILRWLIDNRLVGGELIEQFRWHNLKGPLTQLQYVLMKMDGEREARPILRQHLVRG